MKQKGKWTAKAHCFHVFPQDGTAEEIRKLLRSFPRKAKTLSLSKSPGTVVCEPHWRTAGDDEFFTATAFRVRTSGLPSGVGKEGPEPLPIPEDMGLGEPMCFAYDPVSGVAIVLSGDSRLTERVIPMFLADLGFPHQIDVQPILRTDMLERLERTKFVNSMTFRLTDIQGQSELSKAGEPIRRAIELVDSVRGMDIRVHVSVSKRERGLTLNVVKQAFRRLHDLGSTHVKELKLSAAEKEDMKYQQL